MFKYEGSSVTFSRNLFAFLCLIILALAIALMLSLSKASSAPLRDTAKKARPETTTNLSKALDLQDFVVLILPNAKGEIEVLTPNGDKVPPCGIREGSEVPKDCALDGEIKNLMSVNIGIIKENPLCMWIEVGNTLRKVHVGGDVDADGNVYRSGWRRCHGKPATSPPHSY